MASMHPYKTLADRHFWSRAVSHGFDADQVATLPFPLLRAGQTIMSAGSCFAATLVPYLERSGFHYVRTNERHPDFKGLGSENFSYDIFSAGYGNIYTARHLLQLTRRCLGTFSPQEDRWYDNESVIDAFRPGLRFFARTDREFDLLTRQYLDSVAAAFRSCDVFIFTLGLTEAWRSKRDGAVFPACPGTIAGTFDSAQHEFVNFTAREVAGDLNSFVETVRTINRDVRIILTVSPVPMIATASRNHVLAANTYTKSVLRVAAEEAANENENVFYFPFYEIVTGPQARKDPFEEDRRSISRETIDMVMSLFFSRCDRGDAREPASDQGACGIIGEEGRLADLSDRFSNLECEEGRQDS